MMCIWGPVCAAFLLYSTAYHYQLCRAAAGCGEQQCNFINSYYKTMRWSLDLFGFCIAGAPVCCREVLLCKAADVPCPCTLQAQAAWQTQEAHQACIQYAEGDIPPCTHVAAQTGLHCIVSDDAFPCLWLDVSSGCCRGEPRRPVKIRHLYPSPRQNAGRLLAGVGEKKSDGAPSGSPLQQPVSNTPIDDYG